MKTLPLPLLSACASLIVMVVVLGAALSASNSASSTSSSSLPATESTSVNIHIKLSPALEQAAMLMNIYIHQRDPTEKIDLAVAEQPHITLYLTLFPNENLQLLAARMSTLIDSLATPSSPFPANGCNLTVSAAAAAGTIVNSTAYVLWNMPNPACLQYLSDAVVNATVDLIVPNQPVPSWVWSLPADIAAVKARYVRLYGSPNVFDQFEPHVSLAGDDSAPALLGSIIRQAGFRQMIPFVDLQMTVETVALGLTGPYGTVLRGQDLRDYPISHR